MFATPSTRRATGVLGGGHGATSTAPAGANPDWSELLDAAHELDSLCTLSNQSITGHGGSATTALGGLPSTALFHNPAQLARHSERLASSLRGSRVAGSTTANEERETTSFFASRGIDFSRTRDMLHDIDMTPVATATPVKRTRGKSNQLVPVAPGTPAAHTSRANLSRSVLMETSDYLERKREQVIDSAMQSDGISSRLRTENESAMFSEWNRTKQSMLDESGISTADLNGSLVAGDRGGSAGASVSPYGGSDGSPVATEVGVALVGTDLIHLNARSKKQCEQFDPIWSQLVLRLNTERRRGQPYPVIQRTQEVMKQIYRNKGIWRYYNDTMELVRKMLEWHEHDDISRSLASPHLRGDVRIVPEDFYRPKALENPYGMQKFFVAQLRSELEFRARARIKAESMNHPSLFRTVSEESRRPNTFKNDFHPHMLDFVAHKFKQNSRSNLYRFWLGMKDKPYGYPLWAQVFFAIRCGDLVLAAQVLGGYTDSETGRMRYPMMFQLLKDSASTDSVLHAAVQRAKEEYNTLNLKDSSDTFLTATYGVMAHCVGHIDNSKYYDSWVVSSFEDYMWLKLRLLSFVSDDSDVPNSARPDASMPLRPCTLKQWRAEVRHHGASVYEKSGPLCYVQVLLASQSFDKAVEYCMVTDHAQFGVHLGIALNYLGVLNRPERTLLESSWALPETNGSFASTGEETSRDLAVRSAREIIEDGTHVSFDRVIESYVKTVLKQVFERTQSDMRQRGAAGASGRMKALRMGEHSLGRACHYALVLYPINSLTRSGVITSEFRRTLLFLLENTRDYDFVIRDAMTGKAGLFGSYLANQHMEQVVNAAVEEARKRGDHEAVVHMNLCVGLYVPVFETLIEGLLRVAPDESKIAELRGLQLLTGQVLECTRAQKAGIEHADFMMLNFAAGAMDAFSRYNNRQYDAALAIIQKMDIFPRPRIDDDNRRLIEIKVQNLSMSIRSSLYPVVGHLALVLMRCLDIKQRQTTARADSRTTADQLKRFLEAVAAEAQAVLQFTELARIELTHAASVEMSQLESAITTAAGI